MGCSLLLLEIPALCVVQEGSVGFKEESDKESPGHWGTQYLLKRAMRGDGLRPHRQGTSSGATIS